MEILSENQRKKAWRRKWTALHYLVVVGAIVLCAYLAVGALGGEGASERRPAAAERSEQVMPAEPRRTNFDRTIDLIEVLTPLLAPGLTYFLYRRENRSDE
jgi:flagellar basal body-associated protein FliL